MADKVIKGLTVEIGGDTKKLGAAIDDADKRSKTLSTELGKINKLLKFDEANPELLAQKQKVLTEQIGATSEKLKSLRELQEKASEAMARGEDVSQEKMRALQREIIATEGKLGQYQTAAEETTKQIRGLGGALEENADQFDDSAVSADKLEDSVDELGKAEQDAEQKTGKLSGALRDGLSACLKGAVKSLELTTAAITATSAAALKFAKDSVSVGMEFDASVSQIGATLGYTVNELRDKTSEASQNMQILREKAQEMGAATSFSATEAAEGLNILAMSGYSAVEATGMIGDVLNLAAAGGLSLADAAAYTSGAVKGFADNTKTAQYYTDLMAKGATLANTDVKALGEALSGGAATAASYRQSADTLTLSLLRMAEQGSTGSTAATALNRAMADLYTPSAAAQKALDDLGISAYDASGKSRDFNEVVDELNAALSRMEDQEANTYKSTIFTSQGLQAFNKMTVTSTDKVDEWADALANASGSAGAQAETMLDNLQGDITVFGSAMEGAKTVLSDTLTPSLRQFVQLGTDSVSKLTEAFKEGGLSGAISAVGPILNTLIEKVSGMLPIVISVATELISALSAQLPTLVSAILPPLLDGVAQLVEALVPQLPALLEIIFSSLESFFSPELVSTFASINGGLMKELAKMLPAMLKSLVSDVFPQLVESTYSFIPDVVSAAMEFVVALGEAVPDMISAIVAFLPDIVNAISSALLESTPIILEAGITLLTSLVGALPEIAMKIVSVLPSLVGSIVQTLLSMTTEIVQAGVELLVSLVKAAPQIIQTITAALPKIIEAVVSTLESMIPELIQCGIELFTALITALPEIISAIVKAAPQIVSAVIAALKALFPQIVRAGYDLFVSLISNIEPATGKIVNAAKNVVTSVKNAFLSKVSEIRQVGKNLIEGLWNGISDMASWIHSKIVGFGQGILDKLKGFFGIASPSKVFRNQIGKNLPLGLAAGVDDEAGAAVGAVQKMADDISGIEFSTNPFYYSFGGSKLETSPASFERDLETQWNVSRTERNIVASDPAMIERMDRILAAVERGHIIALDGDKLVGETVGKFNEALGEIELTERRR